MVDVVDKATRSRMMAGIKGKDTKPELLIRKALFAQGLRYRLHVKNLPGKPDLVFPKYHAVIFVHGCFWHGHSCRYFKIPQSRTEFWLDKINQNKTRDNKHLAELLNKGWRVLVVWECATKKHEVPWQETLIEAIVDWLTHGPSASQIDGDGLAALLPTTGHNSPATSDDNKCRD